MKIRILNAAMSCLLPAGLWLMFAACMVAGSGVGAVMFSTLAVAATFIFSEDDE